MVNKEEIEFKVKIDFKLERKLRWFVNNYEKEIGGFLIGKINQNEIYIEDILFPEQEVDSGAVDTESSALVKLRKEYGEKCMKIIGHWHSHNTMDVFWSGTDEEFIEKHSEQRAIQIFIVSAKNKIHRVRLELRNPLKISLDKLPYEICTEDKGLEEEMKKVMAEKVIEKTYTYSQFYDRDEEEINIIQDKFEKTIEVNSLIWRKASEIEKEIRGKFGNKVEESQTLLMNSKNNLYKVTFKLKRSKDVKKVGNLIEEWKKEQVIEEAGDIQKSLEEIQEGSGYNNYNTNYRWGRHYY